MTLRPETVLAILLDLMAEMTPEQRMSIFDGMEEAFCSHCASDDSGGYSCQCWNDE